jgi:hypothetical protein
LPKPVENISSDIVDLLKDRYEIADAIDEKGNFTDDPSEIKVFSFNYVNKKGEDKGSVVVSLLDDNESSNSMKIYFGQDLADADSDSKTEWYEFLQDLRQFAKMHLLGFDVRNINKSQITRRDVEKDLVLTTEDIAPMFESSFSPIDGTVKTSRQRIEGSPIQIVIKHTSNVDPDIRGGRSRRIEKIYLVNGKNERFLLPFKNLVAARAMARHIESGGTPYDAAGRDICQLVEEMMSLNKFYRTHKNSQFTNKHAADAIAAARERYLELKRTLASLSTKGGYAKNSPSLTGAAGELEDADEMMEDIFDGAELDEDSQLALPHVMRAYRSHSKTDEEGEFEKWVNAANGQGEGDEVLMDTGVDEKPETCGLCGGDDPDCWACGGSGDKELSDLRRKNRQADWDDEDFGHSMAGFNESKDQIKQGKKAAQRDIQLLKQQKADSESHPQYEYGGMNGSVPTSDEISGVGGQMQFESEMSRLKNIVESYQEKCDCADEDGPSKFCRQCDGTGFVEEDEHGWEPVFKAEDFEDSAVRGSETSRTDPDQRNLQYNQMAGSLESKKNAEKSLNENNIDNSNRFDDPWKTHKEKTGKCKWCKKPIYTDIRGGIETWKHTKNGGIYCRGRMGMPAGYYAEPITNNRPPYIELDESIISEGNMFDKIIDFVKDILGLNPSIQTEISVANKILLDMGFEQIESKDGKEVWKQGYFTIILGPTGKKLAWIVDRYGKRTSGVSTVELMLFLYQQGEFRDIDIVLQQKIKDRNAESDKNMNESKKKTKKPVIRSSSKFDRNDKQLTHAERLELTSPQKTYESIPQRSKDNKDYAGVGGGFEFDWRRPYPGFGLNPNFDPKAEQRFKKVTASMERDNFYATHTREECKAEWARRYDKLKSMNESIPDREDSGLRNEWTACEEYGHRYDIDGEEFGSCIDCGEPKIENYTIDYSHDPIITRERKKFRENVSIIDELLSEYIAEADVPTSAGFLSPLSFVANKIPNHFHSSKEIAKHRSTTGKLSPFTLLNSPEKDQDSDGKDLDRIVDLARAPRQTTVNSGGFSGEKGNEKPSTL